jgi:hypothetical protein
LTGRNHITNGMACITEGAVGFPNGNAHIPPQCATELPVGFVRRPHLLAALRDAGDLVLVCTPAGHGKTSPLPLPGVIPPFAKTGIVFDHFDSSAVSSTVLVSPVNSSAPPVRRFHR